MAIERTTKDAPLLGFDRKTIQRETWCRMGWKAPGSILFSFVSAIIVAILTGLNQGWDLMSTVYGFLIALAATLIPSYVWFKVMEVKVAESLRDDRILSLEGQKHALEQKVYTLESAKADLRGVIIQCGALKSENGLTHCWFYAEITSLGSDSSISQFSWTFAVERDNELHEGTRSALTGGYYFTYGMLGAITVTQYGDNRTWILGLAEHPISNGHRVHGDGAFWIDGIDPVLALSPGTRWTITFTDHEGKAVAMYFTFTKMPQEVKPGGGAYLAPR